MSVFTRESAPARENAVVRRASVLRTATLCTCSSFLFHRYEMQFGSTIFFKKCVQNPKKLFAFLTHVIFIVKNITLHSLHSGMCALRCDPLR